MNFYLRLSLAALVVLACGYGVLQLAKRSSNPVSRVVYQPTLQQVKASSGQPTARPKLNVGLLVPILMYHHVGDLPENSDSTRGDLTVSTSDFTTEVAWLAQQGYHSVSLEQVYQAAKGKLQLPSKPVVFTFDDGYVDALVNVPPILRQYGFTGSFAVITRFPGQPDYATWDQIRAAKQQGMEIVSHTQDHFDGTSSKYTYDFIKQNLRGSQEDLANELGEPAHILIYPYGHFTDSYIAVAQSVGFDMALTTAFGNHTNPDDLMRVPRVRVHGQETMQRFEELLNGVIPRHNATSPDNL